MRAITIFILFLFNIFVKLERMFGVWVLHSVTKRQSWNITQSMKNVHPKYTYELLARYQFITPTQTYSLKFIFT